MRTTTVLLVLLAGACDSGAAPFTPSALHSGNFRYVAQDSSGRRLLEGEFDLIVHDDSILQGSWRIGWASGADTTFEVGPQVGSGTLEGARQGDHFIIDLNPGWADNNTLLRAVAGPAGFTGQWEWETISGPRTGGRFVATTR